jgi:hypothetical protein
MLVRALVNDHATNNKQLGPLSSYQMGRLLRGRGFKAVLYYAALTYKPESIENSKGLGNNELQSIFAPIDLAALIAVVYFYRTARKKTPPAAWQHLAEQLPIYADIGGFLGYAIPKMSFARGLIVGTAPLIGQAAFAQHDQQGFAEYLRTLKRQQIRRDMDYEMKRWGCTSVQIASILMQTIGLGVPLADEFTRGLSTTKENCQKIPDEEYSYFIAEIWTEALNATAEAPQQAHRGDFYPLQPEYDRLIKMAKTVQEKGSLHRWLERGKNDISPEKTPLLTGLEEAAQEPPAAVSAEAEAGAAEAQKVFDDLEQ